MLTNLSNLVLVEFSAREQFVKNNLASDFDLHTDLCVQF